MALPDIKYFLGIGENPTEPKIHLSQYDTGNTFRVFLVSHGHFVGIDNDVSAVIVGNKPDGTTYAYNCEISSSQTAVIVTVTDEMTAVTGNTEAEIILTCANGRRAGTCNFIIAVEESPIEGTTVSQTDLEAVYQAVTLAADVKQTQTEIESKQATLEAMQDALAGMQAELREEQAFELVFTAPISEPIVTQTAIPATANHTEEEVAAAYAAGKRVNARIHFTNENPISFDLEPVYTVTMQTDGTERHMYNGLLVVGTDQIDAYAVMAAWDDGNNGEPVIMITGKVADYAEAVAGLETDVSNLGNRVTALEGESVVAVPVRIPFYVITNAITQSQATGETKRVDPSKVTTTEDLETLYNAVDLAMRTGKPVRFDLAILGNSGNSAVLGASVMRVSIIGSSQTETRIGAYFTHADLNFSNNFNGLARLEISVVEERTDNGTVYSVAAYATAEV